MYVPTVKSNTNISFLIYTLGGIPCSSYVYIVYQDRSFFARINDVHLKINKKSEGSEEV